MAGLLVEIVLTFIFVLTILGVTDSKAGHGSFGGLIIGWTLTLVHILGIGLTGTSVNPARSIGPAYMGRFTFPMLMDFKGFRHVLTVLARGYLFREDGSGYDRIDYARRALLAWCSLSGEKTKKASDLDD